ncbi:DNA polymerase Y family protein [Streptomyces sp. NRRL B-24484]|uniref:DNA polymerase Y family protein n=1 Tax=Streptomyces sp. NRRL B-24484 TaxID=1463833 RepID=UPI000D12D60F|nr:hypothetical protein [Streptomyces sp. NRRL B-24484]
MHVRTCGFPTTGEYRSLLEVLRGISPVVQALPPGAALADVRGALGYFGRSAGELAELVRLRAVALLGLDVRIGVASTRVVSAMASAWAPLSGGVVVVEPGQVERFMAPLPVGLLDGIGPKQAAALERFGLATVGQLVTTPEATVERILGHRAGRMASERARGVDVRRVVPADLPASACVRHRFDQDEHDGPVVRAALLQLTVGLGAMLRERRQVARSLGVEVRVADRSRWEKARVLPEPSALTQDLRDVAYGLLDTAGLQRARIRGLALRGEHLVAVETASRQLSLDTQREAGVLVEQVGDRINARFGPGAVRPAATLRAGAVGSDRLRAGGDEDPRKWL